MIGDVVRVFNRAPFALQVTKDGKQTVLYPGENSITRDLVLYAKQQNPVPGSDNPHTLIYESFISYIANTARGEKQKDSLDPIPQDVIDVLPAERINRYLLPEERQKATPSAAPFFPKGRLGMEAPTEGVMDPGSFDK